MAPGDVLGLAGLSFPGEEGDVGMPGVRSESTVSVPPGCGFSHSSSCCQTREGVSPQASSLPWRPGVLFPRTRPWDCSGTQATWPNTPATVRSNPTRSAAVDGVQVQAGGRLRGHF